MRENGPRALVCAHESWFRTEGVGINHCAFVYEHDLAIKVDDVDGSPGEGATHLGAALVWNQIVTVYRSALGLPGSGCSLMTGLTQSAFFAFSRAVLFYLGFRFFRA